MVHIWNESDEYFWTASLVSRYFDQSYDCIIGQIKKHINAFILYEIVLVFFTRNTHFIGMEVSLFKFRINYFWKNILLNNVFQGVPLP